MKQLERMIREELLAQPNDICVSIYIPQGEVKRKRDDLNEMLVEASGFLKEIFTAKEVEDFLRPLAGITKEELERFEDSMALFRSRNIFRALSLPIQVNRECFVSNHFHVKPLLKWAQEEKEFFCVDFSSKTVDVLIGNLNSFKAIGSFNYNPDNLKTVEDCVLNHSNDDTDPLVFLSGNERMCKKFIEETRLGHIDPSVVARGVYEGDYEKLWRVLNERVRRSSILKVKRSLKDFNVAIMNGDARSDINEIIKAAKEGSIKKLIVSEEDQIWGRFDAYKNNVNRLNKQSNYEDDDLLDSISEKVIENGGEVVMASKKQLPRDKPLLAILKKKAG